MKNMNKVIKLGIILTTFIMMGCAPMSKDAYMRRFSDFTQEVNRNCKSYDADDWERMCKKYEKFSNKWYEKYKDKLSMKEVLLVRSYQARWYYSRGTSVLNDVAEVEQLIRFYVENGMQSDLQRLCEEAHRIGGETERIVNGVLEQLNISVEY